MGRVTDNPFWFAKYAQQLADYEGKPAEFIERLARRANEYYYNVLDQEIIPCVEENEIETPDSTETDINGKTPEDQVNILRHRVKRCAELQTIAARFLIMAPAEWRAARQYMEMVRDNTQGVVERAYDTASLYGLSIGDTIGIMPGVAEPETPAATMAAIIDEADIETRGMCLIQGTPTAKHEREVIRLALEKLFEAGVFELTDKKQDIDLLKNLLYNTGNVRIPGYLKTLNNAGLTYFVKQLESAVPRWDEGCQLVGNRKKWKTVNQWCRNSKGQEFGNNALSAALSNLHGGKPENSNKIDAAVNLLFQKTTDTTFSQIRNI